ncbi:MAG TPA: 3',5'-cyclic-nucleotide phosphodiesterase [Methylomirabilota bacterium]|nr:3',5'-cyclic-nucleotide phosphodiesterase [Methylomirabilota bacterium]
MKIRVLGAYGAEGLAQRPSAFLVNDTILVDGGTVGAALASAEQVRIEHALITHSHLDHVAGLAFLTETLALCEARTPLTIASLEPVVKALRTSIFNDTVWPDFTQLPTPAAPVLKFRTLLEDTEQRVGDLVVTPVAVNHTVPCSGFILHDGTSAIVYSGDTGPTDALWKATRSVRGLRAVILECAFPDRLGALAEVAKHMTPDLIRRELDKLPADVPVLIYHVKPQFHDEIGEQLGAIAGHRISFAEQDRTYAF